MTNHFLTLLTFFVLVFVIVADGRHLQAQQVAANREQRLVRYYDTSWDFEDVDIETLIKRLRLVGISLPVNLGGKVSGTLGVGIPWNSLRDGKAYRFDGVLKSPRFSVDGLELREVLLDLRYRDGVLSLRQLQVGGVGIQQDDGTNDLLAGTASLQLIPRGVLKLDTKLTGFQLSVLSPLVNSLPEVEGTLSGSLAGEVPVVSIRDAKAWKLTALVELNQFSPLADDSRSLPKLEVVLPLTLESGKLSARGFVATIGATEATGDGTLTLEGDMPWRVNSKVRSKDVTKLLTTVNAISPTAALAQACQNLHAERAAATVVAQGDLAEPTGSVVTGHVESGKIVIALPAPTTPRASLPSLPIDTIEFDFRFDIDVVELSEVVAAVAGGRLAGSAKIPLTKADARLDVSWDEVAVSQLLNPFLPAATQVHPPGTTKGRFSCVIPQSDWPKLANWHANGQLAISRLRVYGLQASDLTSGPITLSEGRVTAPELAMRIKGEPSTFDLKLQLQNSYAFRAKVEFPRLEIADFATIPQLAGALQEAKGNVALKSDLRGTLAPLQIQGTGDLRVTAVKYAELMLDELQTRFEIDEKTFELSQVEMQLYGGTAHGAITYPLTASHTGNARFTWQAIDVGALVTKLAEVPTKLSGRSNGRIDLTIPAALQHEPQRWDYTAHVQVAALEANGISVATVSADADQRDEKLTYSAEGKLFGGELFLQGTRTSSAASSGGLASLGTWEFSLKEASLSDFKRAFFDQRARRTPVTGSLSLAAKNLARSNLESIAEGVAWGGTATLSEVNVAGKQVSSGLKLAFSGDERTVRVESLTGDLAGGQLTTDGKWTRAPTGNGSFRFRLRDVPLEQLAALVGETDIPLSGRADVELRIAPGDPWRMDGKLSLAAVKVAGITIRNARVPVRAFLHPTSGRIRAAIGSSRFSVAGGRVTGYLTANRTTRWRLDGKFKFYRIHVGQLSESNYGQGTLSGTLSFKGRNIRSVQDLSGTVRAELEQTQVAEIPLVNRFRNFVPGMPSGATRFDQGLLRARLNRGVVHLDELSLASSQLQIFADGKITLSGRLDLEAAVSTGDRTDMVQARSLFTRFALGTVAPVALLVTANDFLANRVLHLAIGGTMNRPSIRLLPAKILREEAIRFFLRQASGAVLPVAGAATATGAGRSR